MVNPFTIHERDDLFPRLWSHGIKNDASREFSERNGLKLKRSEEKWKEV
jgi:hypothetical protein